MTISRRVAIVRAIVAKDLREFSRDRLWMVLTPVMLVFYIGILWLLPNTVDETIKVGVYAPGLGGQFEQAFDSDAISTETGLQVVPFDSPDALEAAVVDGTEIEVDGQKHSLDIGMVFPDDLAASLSAGEPATVTIYVDAAVPAEVQTAMSAVVREATYAMAGVGLPVTQPQQELVVVGEDRVGSQVSPQELMTPLIAVMVLVVEAMALAGLVAVEIQTRTAKAVVVSPASVGDFLSAKSATGTLLAFGQAGFVLLLVGGFGHQPLLVALALLIGSIMTAGFGMLAGSAGRDFMTTIFISVVFMVPMAVPAIAALFPGAASVWVQVLPTYGFIETIVGVIAYGDSWADTYGYLLLSAAWCVAIFAAGWFVLRRRVEVL
jgi:ABC-2 type transport system permease protein